MHLLLSGICIPLAILKTVQQLAGDGFVAVVGIALRSVGLNNQNPAWKNWSGLHLPSAQYYNMYSATPFREHFL